MRGNLLRGRPVISCRDGSALGTVDRVYLDPKRKRLASFSVVRRRRLRRPVAVGTVDIDAVRAFGPDAVTVDGSAAPRQRADDSRATRYLVRVESLLGRGVFTAGGIPVGRLTGLSFDRAGGRLASLEVKSRNQPIPGLVWADEVLALDRTRIVVAESVLALGPTRAGMARPRALAPTARRFPAPLGTARPAPWPGELNRRRARPASA